MRLIPLMKLLRQCGWQKRKKRLIKVRRQWSFAKHDMTIAESLTEEELIEKDALIHQGFENWSRRDFSAFCKASEKHGRSSIEAIAADIEGKTLAEVRQYAAVFWARYREIPDHEKIIANIEKGEIRLKKILEAQEAISNKISKHRLPLQQIKFYYGQNKGKNYTEEEDRFLVIST